MTLVNVLAHRVDVGVVSGEQFVNWQPLPTDFQARVLVNTLQQGLWLTTPCRGFCQQMGTHLPQTTIREACGRI